MTGPADRSRAGADPAAAREAIARNPAWYHTIEVAPGVRTPGRIDLHGVAARLLPDDLSGRRALDVGTFDGFWAFEMERRGAEVVAIDIESFSSAELPPRNRPELERRAREWDVEVGRGFRIAAELLGSDIDRRACDVYAVSPEALGGPVDFAFSGDILLHLRNPVGALESILSALAPGGTLVSFEPFAIRETLLAPRRPVAHFQPLEREFNWWYSNVAALRAWMVAAGFDDVERIGFARPTATRSMRRWHVAHRGRRPAA